MNKKHLGSNFDDFLESEGLLEECRATAIKFNLTQLTQKSDGSTEDQQARNSKND